MRLVILGATGNVGTSLLDVLAGEAGGGVEEIIAVARRAPGRTWPRTRFVSADITRDDLTKLFRGAGAVMHLAWLIQPGRDESVTSAVNVTGSSRVFRAVAEAGVPALVYASSVGAYSPGPKDRRVDESWPTAGIPTSFYSRHKVAVERQLDRLERERPELRVVRMRPALIFKDQAATEIRRLFIGPFPPSPLVRPGLIPFVPNVERLRFQVVHGLDIGDAYRRAILSDARGAFNIAAEPPIGPPELADLLDARCVPIQPRVLRAAAAAAYRLRLTPTEPGWLDMGLAVPLMDSGRAQRELGWQAHRPAGATLLELLDGIRRRRDDATPPLARASSGPFRARELLTRVGAKQ